MLADEIPEWVRVWSWWRETRGEHEKPFPQQLGADGFAFPPDVECVDYEQALALFRARGVASREVAYTPAMDFAAFVKDAA